jgi:1-deoxy-D-xylulose-5-phosphate synthase
VIHDVVLQKLHVVFCLDRGGLVGEDGATHQGEFDLAYMRILPNLVVSSPMNEEELRNLMYTAQLENPEHSGPFSIRYPRGEGVMVNWKTPFAELQIGKGRKICDSDPDHSGGTGAGEVCILSIGHPGNFVVSACSELHDDGIFPAHYDMRFVKPIDEEILHHVFSKFRKIITVEDGVIKGGFGSAVLEFMNAHGYQAEIKMLGIPDKFIEHGSPKEQYFECGFDADAIADAVREMVKDRVVVKVK